MTASCISATGCTAISASTTSPTRRIRKQRELSGGPQMLQLSMDGRQLYVTNSLYSTWDNQFYPNLTSWMLKIDCDPGGGMAIDPDFYVDFSPARGHEIHLPGGDCTTEIFA